MSDPRVPPALGADPRVWAFTMAGTWEVAEEPLHRVGESYTPAHELHYRAMLPGVTDAELEGHYGHSGAGLGIAFGVTRAEATGRRIGLIPAAQGGSSLDDWNPARAAEGTRSLYGALLDRVRRVTATPGVELGGVLWYQGESDGSDAASADYAERLDAFVGALRRDLGTADLPFLAVQIGTVSLSPPPGDWTAAGWDRVREALRRLPERVPYAGYASAIDLATNDGTHLETPSLIRLGRRLARVSLGSAAPLPVRVERGPDGALGCPVVRVRFEHVEGGWTPADRIPGFVACGPDGSPRSDLVVLAAHASHEEPGAVDVILSRIDDDLRIGYGLGLAPVCVAVDVADMPIPAFAPVPVGPLAVTG